MKSLLSKIKRLGSFAVSHIPHFRSYNKVITIKYESDLCLIVSKLHDKTEELSKGINELTDKYSSAVLTKDSKNIEDLLLMEKSIRKLSNEVSYLLKKNITTTNKIEKINNSNNYSGNKEKIKLINKANDLINKFEISSEKISNLNLIETSLYQHHQHIPIGLDAASRQI
jgi:hypothetical protein